MIEIYFVLNDLFNCVNMCLRALEIDPEFMKAIFFINECIRLLPPLLKEIPNYMHYISVDYGGDFFQDENEEYKNFSNDLINELTAIKTKRLQCADEYMTKNKRKKLIFSLDKTELHTVEQIGQEIIALYDIIQQKCYDICTPINLNIENKEVIKNVMISDSDIEIKNEKESDSNFKTNESNCSSKSNFSLLDFADKRRSTRVKSIRNTKHREFDDDQSIFDNLVELLPESLKTHDTLKLDSLDKENSSNSSSIQLIENKHDPKLDTSEYKVIDNFCISLENFFNSNSQVNIFELFEFFLVQISFAKHIRIPPVFMNIYKLYR